MKYYYSSSAGGFYNSELHDKSIPKDAVEISKNEHIALLKGQAKGKIIVADNDGKPVLSDPVITEASVQSKIDTLEATITQRRIRDAVLTEEGREWLQNIENKIAILRNSLIG